MTYTKTKMLATIICGFMFGGIEKKKMHLPNQNFAFTVIVIFEIQCSSVDFYPSHLLLTKKLNLFHSYISYRSEQS